MKKEDAGWIEAVNDLKYDALSPNVELMPKFAPRTLTTPSLSLKPEFEERAADRDLRKDSLSTKTETVDRESVSDLE